MPFFLLRSANYLFARQLTFDSRAFNQASNFPLSRDKDQNACGTYALRVHLPQTFPIRVVSPSP